MGAPLSNVQFDITSVHDDELSIPSTLTFTEKNNSSKSRAKNWCFTWNNYKAVDITNLNAFEHDTSVEYLIFGYETSNTGTPHLQGFISFSQRLRMTQIKNMFKCSSVHLEVARTIDQAIQYCKKEGNFVEFGNKPTKQGRRSDLDQFKEAVKLGELCTSILREEHTDVFAKYPRFCHEYINDNIPKNKVPSYPLRTWQQILNRDLNFPPLDRKITFIVDYTGNSGKTWFARYYAQCHNKVQIILPGKKLDMAYTVKQDNRVLFVDAPRSKQGDFIQYDFLEEVKNGLIFSGKYESRMKYLAPCHVVVMMNEQPDKQKLSSDRYDVRIVS